MSARDTPLAADPLAGHRIADAPFYQPAGAEADWFETACRQHLPVLLKGPTGCGKTRFVEYMAWRMGLPLVQVACNDDTSAADLTGRHLLDADGTYWAGGPLTLAARHGAICYLDEIVEARPITRDSAKAQHGRNATTGCRTLSTTASVSSSRSTSIA